MVIIDSEVYTFAMAQHVYVQLISAQAPLKLAADKMKRETMRGSESSHRWILEKEGVVVGEFRIDQVAGWWLVDD